MQVFQELGLEIERRWLAANYDETKFSRIAADALREYDVPSQISAWDVAEWTLRAAHLPEQRDLPARFAEPPVTLFHAARFHIDVYFWLQSTTSTHQHGFCGAFQVLHGGSLHSHFEFEPRSRVNFHLAVGDIKLRESNWLQKGDIREIPAGRDYIHSLFHLENPSATIVVRTYRLSLESPQFNYLKPSLALDPFFDNPDFTRKRQIVEMLLKANAPNQEELINELLSTTDLHTAIELLLFLKPVPSFQNLELYKAQAEQLNNRFNNFLETVQARFPQIAEILPPVFDEQARQNEIINRRNFVVDADHRFFLALLLNVPGKTKILSLVAQRQPDQNPIDTILDWTDELARTRIANTANENAIGISDWSDVHTVVLEGMLHDKSAPEIAQELTAIEGQTVSDKVPQIYDAIKNAALFRALWLN